LQSGREMTMAEKVQFTIGANASCSDGQCGQVKCVVIDPLTEAVTHLVIEAKHRIGLGRLVPLDLIDTAQGDITLHCDLAAFGKLEPAEDTQFMPGSVAYATYGPGQALSWPYYGLGPIDGLGAGNVAQAVTYDTLPLGEMAVHRGEQVHATDGEIGKVKGLVIDRTSHHVSHVLLEEGHLWGRKEVAIPISAVAGFDKGIQLNLTKDQVQDLPAVDIEHPTG
jgi:sporulation protein YlmC with PRC-barrel domain